MTSQNGRPGTAPRRPYTPPELGRVSLVPEEAVLASCKNASTQGPQGASFKCTGAPTMCSHNGS
jgi:hypothetical protein